MMKTILFCAIATILSAVGPAAQAWAAQCPGSFPSPNAVGARIFTTGAGSVSATFCDGAAGYTSNMYLADPEGIYIATGHVTPSGDTVDLGVFQVGQELVFSIWVHDSNQYYFSGPGSWNPDGVPHATVTYLGEGTYHVGFEDLYGGGDGDYDDINLIIEGPLTTELPPVSCASDLMLAIHDQTKDSQLYSPLGLGHQDYFYTEYGNRAGLSPATGVAEIFTDVKALVKTARKQVLVQTAGWDLGEDPETKLIEGLKALNTDLLSAGCPERVEARILVDLAFHLPQPSWPAMLVSMPMAQTEFFFPSFMAQKELDKYACHFEAEGLFGLQCVNVVVGVYPHVFAGNLHSKTIVVDGRAAIVTSANFDEQWANEHGFCVEGNVACALQYDFASAWERARWYNREYDFDGDGEIYTKGCALQTYLAGQCNSYKPGTDLPIQLECEPLAESSICAPLGEAVVGGADQCLPMMVIGRPANGTPGEDDQNTHNQAYMAAFENAQEVINILTPNLNDSTALEGIVDAVEKGVDVRVILSKGFNDVKENVAGGPSAACDRNEECVHWLIHDSGLSQEQLCDHLDVRWYTINGEPVTGNPENVNEASHGKYLSVDGQVAIAGSTNMDAQSWDRSREVDIVADSAMLVDAWDAQVMGAFDSMVRAEELANYCP